MSGWLQDLQHEARLLRRYPAYAAIAVAALGIGIGSTSAIFSIIDATLLRDLPYPDAERLVMVWERNVDRGYRFMYASPPNFADWRDEARSLEEIGAFTTERMALSGGDNAVAVQGAQVTARLFAALGVSPRVGRPFQEADMLPGGSPLVILSDPLWSAQFARDPGVVGRTVEVDGEPATIVGVMPPGFSFPPEISESGPATGGTDLWTPLPLREGTSRAAHFLTTVARVREGIPREAAEEELRAIATRLERAYPDTNEGWTVTTVPLHEQLAGQSRGQLALLLGAVGLVLMIACINVANLLLARGTARREEIAVRAAIGASRARLVRQLLTESFLLGLAGGAVGLALARIGLRSLVGLAPETVLRASEAALDLRVVLFTFAVSMLSAVLFGLVPAWSNSSLELSGHLREGGWGEAGARAHRRFQSAFIAGEIALSLALLVAAGLMFQTFLRLSDADVGVAPEQTLTATVALPQGRYTDDRSRVTAYGELRSRIAALPEVEAAGFIYDVPLAADRQGTQITLPGETEPPEGENRGVNFSIVTSGYFDAMGIPVRRGRDFSSADRPDGDPVVIVNEALADQFFPGTDPLFASIGMFGYVPRIVGVVGNVRHESLRVQGNPVAYLLFDQAPWRGNLSLVVRSRSGIGGTLESVRREIRRFDPGVPVYDATTMEQVLAESVARERFSATLMGIFSLLALVLASVGVFGVVSYAVGRRRREMGVRIALGAQKTDVLRLLVSQSIRPVLIGVVVGLPAAFGLARILRNSLYGVGSADPMTFAGVVAVLTGVSLLAIYVPARRATRVDPAVALRSE
jgi:putative ABC transport system permease protein